MPRKYGTEKFRKRFAEATLKKFSSREGIILHCSECDSTKHNFRTCPAALERQRRNRLRIREIKGRDRMTSVSH